MIKIVRTFNISIGNTQQERIIALKYVAESIKNDDQKLSTYYISKMYKVLSTIRLSDFYSLSEAYISTLSDEDISKGRFPDFNLDEAIRVSDTKKIASQNSPNNTRKIKSENIRNARNSLNSLNRNKSDQFSHLPSGHQTLLGVGNIIGNGISMVFIFGIFIFIVTMILGLFD